MNPTTNSSGFRLYFPEAVEEQQSNTRQPVSQLESSVDQIHQTEDPGPIRRGEDMKAINVQDFGIKRGAGETSVSNKTVNGDAHPQGDSRNDPGCTDSLTNNRAGNDRTPVPELNLKSYRRRSSTWQPA
jgi:hypothetical protein